MNAAYDELALPPCECCQELAWAKTNDVAVVCCCVCGHRLPVAEVTTAKVDWLHDTNGSEG